jgi:hypothetical protein
MSCLLLVGHLLFLMSRLFLHMASELVPVNMLINMVLLLFLLSHLLTVMLFFTKSGNMMPLSARHIK